MPWSRFVQILTALLFTLVLLGCDNSSKPKSDVEQLKLQLKDLSLDDFFYVANQEMKLRDPESVVIDGFAEEYQLKDKKLTDISKEYLQTSAELALTIKNMLETNYDRDALSIKDKISFDVLAYDMQKYSEAQTTLDYQFMLSRVLGQLFYFFDGLPLSNKGDIEDYLEYSENIDEKLDQLIDRMKSQQSRNIIEPEVIYYELHQFVIELKQRGVDESPLLLGFDERLNSLTSLTAAEKSKYSDQMRKIIEKQTQPVINELATLSSEMILQAPSLTGLAQYTGGQQAYQTILNKHTTTQLTAEEIHQIGQDQLVSIHQQMNAIFDQLGYPEEETLRQKYDRVIAESGVTYADDLKDVLESIIETSESRSSTLFNEFPQTPLEVTDGPDGGYFPAPLDGSQPAYYTIDLDIDHDTYLLPTLTFHEAIPGHHYQIALAREADLPRFRLESFHTAYVEGWGLYAERLAKEFGWHDDNIYSELGRLQFEAMRAARLIVDTGLHHYSWDFERAVTEFIDATGMTDSWAEGQVYRYSYNPGQATAYMIGMLKIEALRAQYAEAQGEQFNLADFHSLILNNGSMPLDVLEQMVQEHITSF